MVGRKPRVVAMTEARQEGGIKGIIGRRPIGSYHYAKTVSPGEERLCKCIVFLMLVTHEAPILARAEGANAGLVSERQGSGTGE